VNPESVKLTLNGDDVTSQANVSADNIVYRATLPTGANKVQLAVADMAGNSSSTTWSFTVTGTVTTGEPNPPVILEPKADTQLTGEITVRGTAAPGSTVRVRTTYSGTVLVILSQDGEANVQEVKTGSDGKWQTQAFTLPAPSGLKNIKYTITATTIDSKGLSSEPTQMTYDRR
jgi:hypothetical protein